MTEYRVPRYLWDNVNTARLLELHEEGKSDSQIAAILNEEFRQEVLLTKNAVVGRRHRLGIVRSHSTHRVSKPRRLIAEPSKKVERINGVTLPSLKFMEKEPL
jgi:hypothetical protein